jgi:hypothetical protein
MREGRTTSVENPPVPFIMEITMPMMPIRMFLRNAL